MRCIDELRSLLTSATDLSEPWDFFHDRVVPEPAFMAMGHASTDPKLVSVLAAAASKATGESIRVVAGMSCHVPEHGLWHGMCSLGSRHAIWFYFTAIDVGLAGLTRNILKSQIELVRFSCIPISPGSWIGTGPRAQG